MEAHNLHDLRELARRRLPHGIFEYIDRGVEDEVALRENRDAFARVKLRPYALRDVSGRSTATSLFGSPMAMPVAVAPTGSAGLVWYQGELELARAAAAAGVPFTLATAAMTSMETIAAQVKGRLWFQLNMFADRSISHAMVNRASALGFEALVLTADCSVTPNREYNARNGFALPFKMSPRTLLDMSLHPRWFGNVLLRYLFGSGLPRYENYPPELRTAVTRFSTAKGAGRCEDLGWDDVRELRRIWPRTLIVKGLLRPEDAVRAVDLGVDAVVVSNHGGRTVDSTEAPIAALPRIADAIGGRATVLMDSGVRRGSDVLKALALGAQGVLVGRPTLFGTAVAGQAGAAHALALLQAEIEREMGLMGLRSVAEVDRGLLATARSSAP
jgi:isopentenyl diphosphate isomerase/L-lactate dehydrogenase-like FMN-dependent dehydrogenase